MRTRTYRIRRPSDKSQTHWIFEVMTSDGYWLWMGSANTKKGCERRIKKLKADERARLREASRKELTGVGKFAHTTDCSAAEPSNANEKAFGK